jgi:hypothetical protein
MRVRSHAGASRAAVHDDRPEALRNFHDFPGARGHFQKPAESQNDTQNAGFAPYLSYCGRAVLRSATRSNAETNPRNVHTCVAWRPNSHRRISGFPPN